jgi:hypothetical protein
LKIEQVSPLKWSQYDSIAEGFGDCQLFHFSTWLQVIREAYGHEGTCFVARRGDDIEAVLPVVEVASWLTGKRGVSIPFADLAPPLAANRAAFELVLAAALRYGQSRGWSYFELRGAGDWMGDVEPTSTFRAHHLDLAIGEQALLKRFESRVRGAIRKAEKAGVRTEVSTSLEVLRLYYELHCETRKRHGTPPQPFHFFHSLFTHALSKGQGFTVMARYEGEPVAGAVFLHQGGRAVYKFSASSLKHRSLQANNLVLWTAIRTCASMGIASMHFGRTDLSNSGLRKYKTGWATVESPLHYVRYEVKRRVRRAQRNGSSQLPTRVLAKIPDPLFRLAGSVLYRHLS